MQQLALNQHAPPPPSSHHTARASKLAVGSELAIIVVDATIRSRLFWSYGIVVDIIGEVIQEVAAWAETFARFLGRGLFVARLEIWYVFFIRWQRPLIRSYSQSHSLGALPR